MEYIKVRPADSLVGGSGFHLRVGDDAFEIGYWIRASRAGDGGPSIEGQAVPLDGNAPMSVL